jgi:ATP-binding cassette subfamily B protein
MIKSFPHYKQPDFKDCGSNCVKIIAKYYEKTITIQNFRRLSETTRGVSSLLGLSNPSEK